jgi:membrane-associated phospholipid phosphatase
MASFGQEETLLACRTCRGLLADPRDRRVSAEDEPRYGECEVDWTLFHLVNGTMQGRDGVQDVAEVYDAWALFLIVAIAGAIWFVARPGGPLRPKVAALSAAVAAPLALLVNMLLGHLWYHDRPFVDHPGQTVLLVRHAADNSFPSDHASVAFAIALTVLAYYRRVGLLLLVGAVGIGLARILVGVHYPIDIGVSMLVGLACAVVLTTAGRPPVTSLARRLSKLSDPIVATVRRRLP